MPGIDGVGRGPDGRLRYFVLPDTTMGAMAEQTLIDVRRSIVLPEDSGDNIARAPSEGATASHLRKDRLRWPAGKLRGGAVVG